MPKTAMADWRPEMVSICQLRRFGWFRSCGSSAVRAEMPLDPGVGDPEALTLGIALGGASGMGSHHDEIAAVLGGDSQACLEQGPLCASVAPSEWCWPRRGSPRDPRGPARRMRSAVLPTPPASRAIPCSLPRPRQAFARKLQPRESRPSPRLRSEPRVLPRRDSMHRTAICSSRGWVESIATAVGRKRTLVNSIG